jgi:hypothetical protein
MMTIVLQAVGIGDITLRLEFFEDEGVKPVSLVPEPSTCIAGLGLLKLVLITARGYSAMAAEISTGPDIWS